MRALCLAALLALASPAAACGPGAPACSVEGGSYHIALPEGDIQGSVVFLHGAGGTSRGVMKMTGMIEAFARRGYAVIAPQGLPWREGRPGGIWSFLPDTVRPQRRAELPFFKAVQRDAQDRFEVPTEGAILAGFSAGGFMVSYTACDHPNAYGAYAPVSGGFWRPHPTTCAGPVRLFHTHGWRDSTVPLEGRILRAGTFVQGDIFEGMTLFRTANGCATAAPSGYRTTGQFMRRHWTCAPGSALEMALFPGGHGVPQGWVDMMLDWAEALPER